MLNIFSVRVIDNLLLDSLAVASSPIRVLVPLGGLLVEARGARAGETTRERWLSGPSCPLLACSNRPPSRPPSSCTSLSASWQHNGDAHVSSSRPPRAGAESRGATQDASPSSLAPPLFLCRLRHLRPPQPRRPTTSASPTILLRSQVHNYKLKSWSQGWRTEAQRRKARDGANASSPTSSAQCPLSSNPARTPVSLRTVGTQQRRACIFVAHAQD